MARFFMIYPTCGKFHSKVVNFQRLTHNEASLRGTWIHRKLEDQRAWPSLELIVNPIYDLGTSDTFETIDRAKK